MVLPSLVGMSIAFGGLMGPAGTIAADREDGTLLRAKATPNGMVGYLVGKIVMFALTTLVSVVLLVIPALTVAGELQLDPRTWLLLALVFIVGMVSTVPISVVLGSLMKSAAQAGLLFLASMLLIVPSGIFYPITSMPIWLQCVGQAFPFYWLGLGARSAMLPEAMGRRRDRRLVARVRDVRGARGLGRDRNGASTHGAAPHGEAPVRGQR